MNTDNGLCIDCQADNGVEGCLTCSYNASATPHLYNCESCDDGLIIFNDGQLCIIEIPGCEIYNQMNPSVCDSCEPGYYAESDTECVRCSLRLNMPEGRCLACGNILVDGGSRVGCTQCESGFSPQNG